MSKITEDNFLITHSKGEIYYDYFVKGRNIQIYQFTTNKQYKYWVRIRKQRSSFWEKGEIATTFNTALDLANAYRRELLKNT